MNERRDGLKLVAVKPLAGCSDKYLRILQVDMIYTLCNEYKIASRPEGGETVIAGQPKHPDIFSYDNVSINICGIVGKNGTGKSSLIELFCAAIYNISRSVGLIRGNDQKGTPFKREENVNVHIYYSVDNDIFKIELIGAATSLFLYNNKSGTFEHDRNFIRKQDLAKLFYTLNINYSQYALNSEDIGSWIEAIFNKNDAYQVPITINPFRDRGNIDVNSENYLVRSRLLANIAEGTTSILSFSTGDKIPTQLNFELDLTKFHIQKSTGKVAFNRTHDWSKRILPVLFDVFYGNEKLSVDKNELNRYATEYILNKLHNIVKTYGHYQRYRGFYRSGSSKRLTEYLYALKGDASHITFKLKQAINFLRYDIYPKEEKKFSLSVAEISAKIKSLKNIHGSGVKGRALEQNWPPTIQFIPPSFLKMDIEFSDTNDTLNRLSSGEKQKIYTSASLIYHLKNIESILGNPKEKDQPFGNLIRYQNVNIIFDEIELYYHPDLQRRFVHDLLNNVRNANIRLLASLNFIFVTHSPFILSDIPNSRILYLDLIRGKSVPQNIHEGTFAANIHDILANSFFLKKQGYIGEFAKVTIMDAVNYLKGKPMRKDSFPWTRETVRALIDIIGEPLIYRSLNELYSNKFLKTKSEIDEEIKRLEQLRNKKEL